MDLRKVAHRCLDLGLTTIPIKADGSKAPACDWKKYADGTPITHEEIDQLFPADWSGIGVVGGAASGGFEILEFEGRAVEEGFMLRFDEAVTKAGLALVWDRAREGYTVSSPSGGKHIGFRVDGEPGRNVKLASRRATIGELGENPHERFKTLIETRAQGGQAVCPPSNGSTHPSGIAWTMEMGGFAKIATITAAERDALYAVARTFDVEPEAPQPAAVRLPVSAPSVHGADQGIHPFDWFRENHDVLTWLLKDGWVIASQRGDDFQLTRPGKDVRAGTSATYHADGALLVIFSTSVDPAYERAASHRGSDGSLVLTAGEVYAAVEHGGDVQAAMSCIRRELMPKGVRAPGAGPRDPVQPSTTPTSTADAALNLPDEFWASRPWLAHIRQAARSALSSPDPVFHATIARLAALIPPSLLLPPIVIAPASFDWYGCIVGRSGSGKTGASRIAKALIPSERDDILWNTAPSSGEGLIEAFMGAEVDPETNKPTGKRGWQYGKIIAVHISSDEATGTLAQAMRSGSTMMPVLASAWAGAELVTMAATGERNRYIPEFKRRVSGLFNIQVAFGHQLLSDNLAGLGLSQRMLFCWAHAPIVRGEFTHPGPLSFRPPPSLINGHEFMEIGSSLIRTEITEAHVARSEGQVVEGDLDSHRNLVRLKLAAMMALLDGRMDVNDEDWQLSGMVIECHLKVREQLLAVKLDQDRRAIQAQGEAQAYRELAGQDVKERKAIDGMAARIAAAVEAGPVTYNALRKQLTNGKTKHRFEGALAMALERGLVKVVDISGQGEAGREIQKA